MELDILRGLNDEQKDAVTSIDGYIRVIAGAGSGKTRALTHRYAYLVKECGISPSSILSVTFTNKAAQEMRDRIDKINELSQWITACEYNTIGDVTAEGGLVVYGEEIEHEEQIAFTINVTKKNTPSLSADGVKNTDDFNNHSIKDKAGKKEIKQYYEITMTKTTADGNKSITSVYKDTDSNSKFRITITIPEEYRGYKNYSFVHEHNGEVVTLCDLDNDPKTVTFEVDKFSTFVLTATNEEQGEDVISGDLDLDGKTSATDLSMLKKVLLGTDNGKSPILNDVNDDNKTDICDLVRLKKGLSGT